MSDLWWNRFLWSEVLQVEGGTTQRWYWFLRWLLKHRSAGSILLEVQTKRDGTYKCMHIKCVNTRNRTMYKSEDPDMDKVWYDDIL